MSASEFASAFEILIGHEGGFSNEPRDPGNWTGNVVGSGSQRGTKYGIASGSYATELGALAPDVRAAMPESVADITLDQARAIYRAAYWDRVSCDALPPPLALLVFDAAVNNGVGRAARWLQEAAGAAVDGDIGPETLAAVTSACARAGGAAVCAEFMAQRLAFMASLSTWPVFGLGWSRRLSLLPFQAMTMSGATT
jgi:lysozyme family protein